MSNVKLGVGDACQYIVVVDGAFSTVFDLPFWGNNNNTLCTVRVCQLLISFTLTHVQYAFLKPSLALDTMSNEHAKATQ